MTHRSPHASPAGDAAAAFGLAALVCLVIPVVGDLIALAPALLSIALGLIGMHHHEKGRATRVGTAVAGVLLGALCLLAVAVLFAASQMPA